MPPRPGPSNGLDDERNYQFNVDWEKASALGLTITDIDHTLSVAMGLAIVDEFIGTRVSRQAACSSKAMRHRDCCAGSE